MLTRDFEDQATIDALAAALEQAGHRLTRLPFDDELLERLLAERLDLVFNLCEGRVGRSRESQLPAVLEMLQVPYSGSDPLTLGLTQDKDLAKRLAHRAGIRTPRWLVIGRLQQLDRLAATEMPALPLFVKPNHEGCSKGRAWHPWFPRQSSYGGRWHRCSEYRQPALIEEFLPGCELTVSMLAATATVAPQVLPVAELVVHDAAGRPLPYYPYEMKGAHRKQIVYPADIEPALQQELDDLAMRIWDAFVIRDYCRVDFRVDENGRPAFLEINALPGLSREYSLHPGDKTQLL